MSDSSAAGSPGALPAMELRWAATMLSVLRIVAAFIFLLHGTQKLFGIPAGRGPWSPVDIASQRGIAGLLETFGGSALMLGVFTRPVAFIVSGEMAVAYFQFHFPRGFTPLLNGGETPALLCFIFLYLACAGAGPLSIDAWLARRRTLPSHPRPS